MRSSSILGIAVVVIVCLPPAAAHSSSPAATGGGLGNSAPLYTNISYNSSVDGFPISYGEILPVNYSPTVSYPLLVYFHGEGKSSAIVPGGSGDGLARWNDTTLPASRILIPLVDNASVAKFIIIAPSPRSAEGFYANSTCGGPEAQDTFDAIVHEKSLRLVSSLYALGFSMGSMAALSFVGHHASMFRGVAVTGTLTDAFESIAYHPTTKGGLESLDCGGFPGPSNTTANALYTYLSVARFHPANFSGVRIWVSAGGIDHGAPNNATIWPYLQVNDTFLTRTCLTASAYAEPLNCTTPFLRLHALSPTQFVYRYVFEPGAGHTLGQLEPRDMFQFFQGRTSGGCFTSTFPPTVNTPCP